MIILILYHTLINVDFDNSKFVFTAYLLTKVWRY